MSQAVSGPRRDLERASCKRNPPPVPAEQHLVDPLLGCDRPSTWAPVEIPELNEVRRDGIDGGNGSTPVAADREVRRLANTLHGERVRIGRDPRSRRVPPIERDQAPVERGARSGSRGGRFPRPRVAGLCPIPTPGPHRRRPRSSTIRLPSGLNSDRGHGTLRPRENDRPSAPGQIPYAHGMRKLADRDVPSVATRGDGPDHAPGAKHTSRRRPIAGPTP